MNLITLDFETYFDSDYSLSKLTTEEYVRDPRFKVHCAVFRDPYGQYVVTKSLEGATAYNCAVLCHHAHFDGLILSHHYSIRPAFWFDTLSMARLVFPHAKSHSLGALAKMLGLPEKNVPYESFKGVRDLPIELYNRVAEGCANDVELTYAIFQKLLPHVPAAELRLIDLTVRMFTEPSLALDKERMQGYLARTQDEKEAWLSALGVTKADLQSNEKFAGLLRELGIEPPTKPSPSDPGKRIYAFAKTDPAMKDLLEDDNETVADLANARLGQKSTIGETRARRLLEMAGRGLLCVYLKYAGAHTLRWSGGDKLNWQNFPRGGQHRLSVTAPAGYKLAIGDLSQIECLAENTTVLTRLGYKPIQDVKLDDEIWDGQEFVTHGGVVCKGVQKVISYQGVTATPEHIVYIGSYSDAQAMPLQAAAALGVNIKAADATDAIRKTTLRKSDMRGVSALWRAWSKIQLRKRGGSRLMGVGKLAACIVHRCGNRPDREFRALRAGQSSTRHTSAKCQQPSDNVLCTVAQWGDVEHAGFLQDVLPQLRARPDSPFSVTRAIRRRYSRAFKKEMADDMAQSAKKTRVHTGVTPLVKTAKVYDIVNCGPRYRYWADGAIVSNCRVLNWLAGQRDKLEAFAQKRDLYCEMASQFYGRRITKEDKLERQLGKVMILACGYGMGATRFRITCRNAGIALTDDEAARAVGAYRAAHGWVRALWKEADDWLFALHFGTCMGRRGLQFEDRRVYSPSGNWLDYSNLTCEGREYALQTRRGAVKMYGAKLVENIVQWLSRNIIAEAMLKISAATTPKCKIVLTCHDEVVCFVKEEEAQEALDFILTTLRTPPAWCEGLPLDAEGGVDVRYSK